MKVIAVLGSPRIDGNSALIAERFLDKAKSLGAETKSFSLNKLKYRGCQACYACKTTSETCVLKDDLTAVLDAVRESDVILLATPVYYGDVTAQMKGFIDRTFCYLTPTFRTGKNMSRLKPGKKLVFVQTQGAPESVYGDIFMRYKNIMSYHGFAEAHLLRACNANATGAVANELLESADRLARKIVAA